MVKNPLILWKILKEWYDHQKTVILPRACYNWIHLRLQDFKSVNNYNSASFKISSELKLHGKKVSNEDMLEKHIPLFTPLISFYCNNIESVVLSNILI